VENVASLIDVKIMSLGESSPIRKVDGVSEVIANRRHYSAKRLVGPGPSQSQIEKLFEAAAAAPDHGGETPWRFVLINKDKRPHLGDAFASALYERDNGTSAEDLNKAREKAFNAPFLALAISKQEISSELGANTERLISLGCAIQNILISATALGFGSGLTSGKAMNSSAVRNLFKVNENEVCICFINIGNVLSVPKVTRIRPSIRGFISSL
jgi:nitroreductase